MRRRTVLVVAAAVVAVAGVAAAWRIASVASDLRQAEDLLDDASTSLQDGHLAEARAALSRAESLVLAANERLRAAPELSLVAWMPVVRQNLDSLEDSIEIAATMIHGGGLILEESVPLESETGTLEVSLSDGSIPLDAVTSAHTEIERLALQLPALVPAGDPSPLLLPQARSLRRAVVAEALVRREQLDRLDNGLSLLRELAGADGPRRYLIAVANTAEMRGTGGMMLNYGVLQGANGVVDLTAFGRVDELAVTVPVSPDVVGLPQDFLDRWAGFDLTHDWRNATLSGDFTLMAPVLQAMYRQATGLGVDGVVQVDPEGLAAMLAGVGPVEVDQLGSVTSENVVPLVLNEAYSRFPGVEERSDVLGDVAEAAFRRLVDGDIPSLRALAEALGAAVDGRHVLLHSRSTRAAAAVSAFGATGALPAPGTIDHAHLTVQNMAGNKLDYYLDTSLALRGDRPAGEIGSLQAEITITNTAPAGVDQPKYVFGPNSEGQVAGEYRGAVTLYLPTGTSLEGSSGGPFRIAPNLQTEAGRPLVSFWINVPAGTSRRVVLELQLAPRPAAVPYRMELVPSPRVRPTQASVEIDTGHGTARGEVVLDRTWIVRPDGAPQAASAG